MANPYSLDRRDWITFFLLILALIVLTSVLWIGTVRAESGDTSSPSSGEIAASTVGGSSALAGVVSFFTSRIQTNKRVDELDRKMMVVMGALRYTSPDALRYIDSMELDLPQAPKK